MEKLDEIKHLSSIFFDGKISEKAEKNRKTSKHDIITMITEPNSSYIGDFEPENGEASTIGAHLLKTIDKTESSNTIKLLGADGCAVNTGRLMGFWLQWKKV